MKISRAAGRHGGTARAARGHLAGVGSTGYLLAVAALMSIVASALVGNTGSGAAQTVTGVTQALGGVLSGLGH